MEQGLLRQNHISPNIASYRHSPLELNIDMNQERSCRSSTTPLTSSTSEYSGFNPSGDRSYLMERQNSYFGSYSENSSDSAYQSFSKRYEPNHNMLQIQKQGKYSTFREDKEDSNGGRMNNERLKRTSTDDLGTNAYSEYRMVHTGSITASDDDTELIKDSQLKDILQRKSQKMSKQGKASKSLLSNTEKCKVCLAQAARHVHYGSTSCYSCKAFFRRSIQLGAAFKYTCQTQGNCVMLPNTRKSCQRCRFDRCLAVGMKPDRVLTEKQRAKRFRKVREKVTKTSNNNVEPASSAEMKNCRFHNSPSPTNSLSDGGNNRSTLPESDLFPSTSGPKQRPFLDDWFFDQDFHPREHAPEKNLNSEENCPTQKQSQLTDNILDHDKYRNQSEGKLVIDLGQGKESETNKPQIQIKAEPMDSDPEEANLKGTSEASLDHNNLNRKTPVHINSLNRQKDSVCTGPIPPIPIKMEKDVFVSQVQKSPHSRPYERDFSNCNSGGKSIETSLSPEPSGWRSFKKLRIEEHSRPLNVSPTDPVRPLNIEARYPLRPTPSIPPLCPIDNRDKYAVRPYTSVAPVESRSSQGLDLSSRTMPSATTYNSAPVSSILPIAHSSTHRVIFILS